MSYVDDLINLRPELKELKPCIGNSLADNYVKGLSGRYHTRLNKGVEVAAHTKPEQLTDVIQSLLSDRQIRVGRAPFSIHDVRDSECLLRTLVLALWTSRVVAPSSVNGTVRVKSKKVYGDENYMPPISLQSVQPIDAPAPDPSSIAVVVPAATSTASQAESVGAEAIESGLLADQVAAGRGQAGLLSNMEVLQSYVQRAEEIFMNPGHRYAWNDIVTGAMVSGPNGGLRKFMAVDRNTFRGFHKIDKGGSGAGDVFRNYFVQRRDELLVDLDAAQSMDDLHNMLNRISADIRSGLVNIKPSMLVSYNKIRKPVDLYIEHLVAMADELDANRERLIPLISLPLDSQMFQQPEVFTDADLRQASISRRSTYMDVGSETDYRYLQEALRRRAEGLTKAAGQPFYPIYFDLLWNNRHTQHGTNLFELNP